MLTLYDGTVSVCAIKVRLTLEEKGIPYESRTLDLRRGDHLKPDYLAINPGGVVPTLIDGDETIPESSVIIQYLEDICPEPTALPDAPADRARLRLWLKRIDEPLHPACGVLTHATAFRPSFLAMTAEQQHARLDSLPDPGRRARQEAVYRDGLAAPIVKDAAQVFDRFFRDMETALAARGPFLCGDRWTLADAAATPYANRAFNDLGLTPVWAGTCPRVMEWFEAMCARPSFDAAVTRYFTPKDAVHFGGIDEEAPVKMKEMLEAA